MEFRNCRNGYYFRNSALEFLFALTLTLDVALAAIHMLAVLLKGLKMKLTEWIDFLYALQLNAHTGILFSPKNKFRLRCWIFFQPIFVWFLSTRRQRGLLLFQQKLFFFRGIDVQRKRYLHFDATWMRLISLPYIPAGILLFPQNLSFPPGIHIQLKWYLDSNSTSPLLIPLPYTTVKI